MITITNLRLVDKVLSIPEIQDGVFGSGLLSPSDIARCARVSKPWQKVAAPYIWKTVCGSTIQIDRLNQQGVVANAQWIRSLALARWQVVDWLTQARKCTRLERLELQLFRNRLWIFPSLSKEEEEEEKRNGKENGTGQGGKKDEDQERALMALYGLIQQNPRLKDFRYINKFPMKGFLNRPLVNTLVDSCSPYLLHLEFYHVSLKNSDFHALLNHCPRLQVLKIQCCAFGVEYLDLFDGQFPNLQKLSFISNRVSDKSMRIIPYAGVQYWFPLLSAANKSQQFECFEIGSERLTMNQVSELIQIHGSSLCNITELTWNTILDSDKLMAKILNLVRPLKVLRLINVAIKDETLATIMERHQTTLLELEIRSVACRHQSRGLLSTLRLPKLKKLKVECEPMLFDAFVPQLYLTGEEKDEQQQTILQSKQNVDGFQINTSDREDSISILENQHSRYNWTCLMIEDLNITFPFDSVLESSALRSSWNGTDRSIEELYIQGILLLIQQISKLSKLRSVRISVMSIEAIDENSSHWNQLDGCWEQLFSAHNGLEVLKVFWTVPQWLRVKYGVWYEATFGKFTVGDDSNE